MWCRLWVKKGDRFVREIEIEFSISFVDFYLSRNWDLRVSNLTRLIFSSLRNRLRVSSCNSAEVKLEERVWWFRSRTSTPSTRSSRLRSRVRVGTFAYVLRVTLRYGGCQSEGWAVAGVCPRGSAGHEAALVVVRSAWRGAARSGSARLGDQGLYVLL